MNKVCYIIKQDLKNGLARIYFEYSSVEGINHDDRIAVKRESDCAADAKRLLNEVKQAI
jgi:hypothetical protein